MYRKILCLVCILCLLMLFPAAMGEEAEIELPVDEAGIVELTEEVESDEEELIVSEAIGTEYASASIDFPDEAFRAYILGHFDSNKNGEISSSEAKKVTKIDISGLGVQSLSGIERFTKLKTLLCKNTSIQTVELGYSSDLQRYVKESAPRIVEGSMVFEHNKKIVATLPLGTSITIKGKPFFDPALGLSLSENERLLTVKQKHTLLASGACGYPTAYCRFVVSDKNVLKVSGGTVTAKNAGTATVTVTTFDGLTETCFYEVKKAPSKVTLSHKTLTIGEGQQFALAASVASNCYAEYSWSSDKKKIATVEDGVVTAHSAGKAKITVRTQNGKKATCTVTVRAAATSIRLDRAALKLRYDAEKGTGTSSQLKATLNSGAYSTVSYESDTEDVAIVSADGRVTAVGVGTATITARTDNGLTAACAVTVEAKEKLPVGQTMIVAHRGGLSCGPENTLAAFANSASTGADMIELDVRTTKDKVLVINHDPKIKGKIIKDKKYSELRKLKPDLCTLDQALDVICDSGLLLQVELKDTANVEMTVSAVRAHNMEDRVIYISFEKALLRKVRALDADARLGFIFMDAVPAGLDSFIDELDISALMVHKKLLTQSRLDNWHDRGLQVNVWTIDSYDECVGWISMGVDYITSNYPEVAVSARG